jgi:protein TonB
MQARHQDGFASRGARSARGWVVFLALSGVLHASGLIASRFVAVRHGASSEALDDEEITFHLDLRARIASAQVDDSGDDPGLERASSSDGDELLALGEDTIDVAPAGDPAVTPDEAEVEPAGPPPPPVELAAAPEELPLPIVPEPPPEVPAATDPEPAAANAPEEDPVAAAGSGTPAPPPVVELASGSPGAARSARLAEGAAPGAGADPADVPSGKGASSSAPRGGHGANSAGLGGDTPIDGRALRVLRACRPEYPASCRRREEEGTVTCLLTVYRDGSVLDVVVVKSSGHPALDAAALRALRRWRFEPLERWTDRPQVPVLQSLSFRIVDPRS